MKTILRLILTLTLICAQLLMAAPSALKTYVGQLIKLDKSTAPVSERRYYLFFTHEGRPVGLPIEWTAEMEKQATQWVGKTILIEGNSTKKTFAVAEGQKDLDVIVAKEITLLTFNKLQTTSTNTSSKEINSAKFTSQEYSTRPTYRIPDQGAKGLILGAGAFLMGTIIQDRIKQ